LIFEVFVMAEIWLLEAFEDWEAEQGLRILWTLQLMLSTRGVNAVPAWGSVRPCWRPGPSRARTGADWGCAQILLGLLEVTLLCCAMRSPSGLPNQHCCTTPATRVSPAGLPSSCGVERSRSPECRTSSLLCPGNASSSSSATKDVISAT